MNLVDRLLYKVLKIERSYSQCGEDRILTHLFDSIGMDRITYLDIGTNHPQINNNTYYFYKNGSSGVCVEPNPALAAKIRSTRPRDKCINVGVTAGSNGTADFFLMSSHTLSTFSEEDAAAMDSTGKYKIQKVMKVPIRNINSIAKNELDGKVDLISIDVEGWNGEIVGSIDFDLLRPFCFCVETLTFAETGQGQRVDSIFRVFEENGYFVYADTHINTIFVDKGRYAQMGQG